MKAFGKIFMTLALAAGLMAPGLCPAADADTRALLQELRALKDRVNKLESQLDQAYQTVDKAHQAAKDAKNAAAEARKTSGTSLKISQQIAKTKGEQPSGILTDAGKRLKLYGAIELEGAYTGTKPKKGQSTSESAFNLATAEFFLDATINKYTKGLLHLLWEEGESDGLTVDEAFILIGQTEDIPFYFMGGRIYPAIASFETYLVSDPITQNVFETQATAAEIGWAQNWFNVGVGLYNAGVHQANDAPDSNVNSYYARVQFDAPEGGLGEGLDLNFGLAYTNNIAGGNLGDEVTGQTLRDLVAGWSANLSATYRWVTFNAEYIAALDDFNSGELSFNQNKARPTAFNLELAFTPIKDWTFAVRYEGSSDLGDFEPEKQYGAAIAWDFLRDTTLSLEYLRGEFENDDTRDLVTTQLAIAF